MVDWSPYNPPDMPVPPQPETNITPDWSPFNPPGMPVPVQSDVTMTPTEYSEYTAMNPVQQFSYLQTKGAIPTAAVYDGQDQSGNFQYHFSQPRTPGHEVELEEPPETYRVRVGGHPVDLPDRPTTSAKREKPLPDDVDPNQGELKRIYEREQKQPSWKKFVLGSTVYVDSRGYYRRIVAGEAAVASNATVRGGQGLLKVIAAASGTATVVGGKQAIDKAKAATRTFEKATGRTPTLDDVIAIDSNTGAAMSLGDFTKEGRIPQGWIEVTRQPVPGKSEVSRPAVLKGEGQTFSPQRIKITEYPAASVKHDTYILDPIGKTKDAEDYILKSSAVAVATERASDAFTHNWDEIVGQASDLNNTEAQSALNRTYQSLKADLPADIDSRVKAVTAAAEIMRTKGLTNNDFERAFSDFKAKQAILEDAKRSYVASLNPAPIQGTVNANVLYILAGYKLATYINNQSQLSPSQKRQLARDLELGFAEDLNEKQAQAFRTSLWNRLGTSVRAGSKTGIKEGTKAETKAQAKTEARTQTQTQTQTRAQEATQTHTMTRTREATRTKAKTAARTATRTAALARFGKPELEGKPEEPPKVIPVKRGSLAWEQGRLEVDKSRPGPEEVFYYSEPDEYKTKVSVGVPPKGYRNTGDTPKTTIQTIGGPVKKKVSVDMGITRATALPDQKRITFSQNRFPRITPKLRRLR